MRWNHPGKGVVSPSDFIPVAEETGLIGAIGGWALRQACLTMKRWNSTYAFDPPLEVSVNVSVRQFRQEDFVELVRNVLNETG
ncbi:MAG: EAL domain-containing protein, partial [bacterium]|nr:EAL domain-containing protein [bacterium]